MSAYLFSVARGALASQALPRSARMPIPGASFAPAKLASAKSVALPSNRAVTRRKIFSVSCIFLLRARTDLVFFEQRTCFDGTKLRVAL